MVGVPTFDAYLDPIIECLKVRGGPMTNQEIAHGVALHMGLSDDVRALRHGRTGQTEVEYRIAWSRTALKKDGVIENKQRGLWSLVEEGRPIGARGTTKGKDGGDNSKEFAPRGEARNLGRPASAVKILRPGSSEWPEWSLPSHDEQLRLAEMAVPYVRFLHPEIVQAVVEDNERHRERWAAAFAERDIDPSLYLWHHSSCAFPGIRRHSGSTEIARFKGRMETTRPTDALELDGNSYPKEIWSFVFRGKRFQNTGPNGYQLAHLADHKVYKNRSLLEIDGVHDYPVDKALFGLFTSLSNTAYIPTSLIRPTDFGGMLRSLLQRKTIELYGEFCNLLPPQLSFRSNDTEAWSLDAFSWSAPVGTLTHVAAFLDFRHACIDRLLSTDRADLPMPR